MQLIELIAGVFIKVTLLFAIKDIIEKQPLVVGDFASILVRINKPFDSLNWILVARSVIVKWERVSLPEPQQEYTLSIPMEAATEPHAQVLIYTVLQDSDDVVADSMQIGETMWNEIFV